MGWYVFLISWWTWHLPLRFQEHVGFYQEIDMSATLPATPISSPVSPSEPDSISQSGSQSSVLQITDPGAQCKRHHVRTSVVHSCSSQRQTHEIICSAPHTEPGSPAPVSQTQRSPPKKPRAEDQCPGIQMPRAINRAPAKVRQCGSAPKGQGGTAVWEPRSAQATANHRPPHATTEGSPVSIESSHVFDHKHYSAIPERISELAENQCQCRWRGFDYGVSGCFVIHRKWQAPQP